MELKNRLLWLIVLRFLILTALLGTAALINLVPQLNEHALRLLVAVYAVSLVYLGLWGFSRRYDILFYMQVLLDLALISFLVYSSGKDVDPNSTATFALLYLVVIVYASIILGRKGCVLAVSLSTVFYVGTVCAGYLNSSERVDWKPLSLKFSLNLLAFASVAYLEFYLSERVKKTTAELEEQRSSLGDLQTLHQNIINSIRSGLITTDLEGKIVILNRGACEITGYTTQVQG